MKAFWITLGAIVVIALAVTVGLLVKSNVTNESLKDMFQKEETQPEDDKTNEENGDVNLDVNEEGTAVIKLI